MTDDFDKVWERIKLYQGLDFKTKTKKTFRYKIEKIDSNTEIFTPVGIVSAPKNITKERVKEAYDQWPVEGPGFFSGNILAPSYLWGVFNDFRIIIKD